MEELEKVLDRLNDLPNESEENIFNDFVKVNNNGFMILSPYVVSRMWNGTDAVKYGFASGRTASDFMEAR